MNTRASHVVLGGNGVAGRETVRSLVARGLTTASVGRRPSVVEGARSVMADLTSAPDVSRALANADVAYLTVGLPYSARAWARQWPVILNNTIEAALVHGTHLVYLDNVYAYGRVGRPMTERTPLEPSSRKGRVRAAALAALDDAASRGLRVTVGRSADFYGPGATTSAFNTFVIDRVAADRDGTWLFDADQPHSLTYTRDIGEALAVLGTSATARGGVWHLPTAPALTGREYIRLAAGESTTARVMRMRTMRIGALFNRDARETLEMSYQYTAPYVFESTAFEAAFGLRATPIADGIAACLDAARSRREGRLPATS